MCIEAAAASAAPKPEHGSGHAALKGMTLRTISLVALLLAAAALIAGCGGHDSSATSSTPPAVAAAASPAGGDSTGVPECDSYMKKYLECVGSKVPETSRAQYKAALDQTMKAWRQAAATPEGKAGLAAGCKQAQSTTEQVMKAYGCTF